MAIVLLCDEDLGYIRIKTDKGEVFHVYVYEDYVICPCGDMIELDGECPSGHVSPALDIV